MGPYKVARVARVLRGLLAIRACLCALVLLLFLSLSRSFALFGGLKSDMEKKYSAACVYIREVLQKICDPRKNAFPVLRTQGLRGFLQSAQQSAQKSGLRGGKNPGKCPAKSHGLRLFIVCAWLKVAGAMWQKLRGLRPLCLCSECPRGAGPLVRIA